MALTVNTNVASLNAQRNLQTNQAGLSTVFQRLSSGLRVNSAKDDAAGLAVAEGMSSIIRGSNVAIRNANDGISVGQTAETALGQISNNLQRIREIAVQSANGSITSTQRTNLQKEVDQLTQEISRTVGGTKFNSVGLLDASNSGGITFQIGAGSADTVTVSGANITGFTSFGSNTISQGVTGTSVINITTASGAASALAQLDADISSVTSQRATFGAVQNRFEAVVSGLEVYSENLSAARGRIVDADFAAETAALTRGQILQQASTAILAQANALPQNALTLLK
ncbi:MAG: flagellin FliC [Betaproteobacteria bacterium]|nr:flagellin FliC [Betaproteobacteria bacterium]NCA24531.1 flagellin FliC [Betaproteobacteria bacterium]NDD13563.1 flagellin FliC [Betaproteobacteria bacterium]